MYMDENTEMSAPSSPVRARSQPPPVPRKRAGFRQIFTRNVVLTLLTHFLLAFHTSAFNSMTFVFLPTPRARRTPAQVSSTSVADWVCLLPE